MAKRPKHGSFISLEDLESLNNEMFIKSMEISEGIPSRAFTIDLKAYDYLFKDLVSDPDNLLDSTPEVIQALKDLGAAMREDTDTLDGNSEIPAAYTYLGQFIDHDITLEAASREIENGAFNTSFFSPIPPLDLRHKLKNTRSGSFDLDSVYDGKAPRQNGRFKLGNVFPHARRPPNKIDANDLPRKADTSKAAEIGDARNDENLVIAQLHLAILKFHNAVMRKLGADFSTAEKIVRQHYQWIVLHDFLKRICDANIVNQILGEGNKIYDPSEDNFFMPVEFSAAAYRYGHSMVRARYNFNLNHLDASIVHLFRFTRSSGDMVGLPGLPHNWIIEWENFLPFETNIHNRARRINTQLTVALQHLTGPGTDGIFQFLAKRNLLRGYLLSLPTGQALARKVLGEEGVLSGNAILNNATEDERAALESAGLHIKTPLWYYILAEASIQNGGLHLGKLGSTIVAETIIGLIRRSADSILQDENWGPRLGAEFNLEQMILFADLGPGQSEVAFQ
jgi:hypothetical protein